MTPSAPRSNALMMKSGEMRLLHGARMIRTFGDILRRLVPARSAPVYVHQLQTNATTFGSNAAPGVEASVGEGVGMGTPGASPEAAGTARRRRRAPAPRRPLPGGTARMRPRHWEDGLAGRVPAADAPENPRPRRERRAS